MLTLTSPDEIAYSLSDPDLILSGRIPSKPLTGGRGFDTSRKRKVDGTVEMVSPGASLRRAGTLPALPPITVNTGKED